MKIYGDRIYIRQLELKDVYSMRNWGYHENPLLIGYNFPILNDKEVEMWYKYKTKSIFNKYYSIFNEDNILIGYLGIKNIRFIFRKATLGIVLDPNFVEKSYGEESLRVFLEYYFEEMKMKKMLLDVDSFNKRAINLYKKLGFKKQYITLEKFYEDTLDFHSSYYLENKNSFVIKNKKIYNYIYKMELKKSDFKIRSMELIV